MATGRPGRTTVSWPAGVIASSVSPSRLTSSTSAGTVDDDLLAPDRRDGLQPAGPAPPPMRSKRSLAVRNSPSTAARASRSPFIVRTPMMAR